VAFFVGLRAVQGGDAGSGHHLLLIELRPKLRGTNKKSLDCLFDSKLLRKDTLR
jgi:hypothetical protein